MRLLKDRTMGRWFLGWVGAAILGIINGAGRELLYKDRVGESRANQTSALLALYFWFLQRRWPLASTWDAASIGTAWAVLTVLFEFGFGRYVDGDSWEELFENYDLRKGNLWPFVLLSIAGGPATVRTIANRWRS
jgi:hypothetical protein